MYSKIGSHNGKISTSSVKLIDYLSKESDGKGHFFSNDYGLENQMHYDFEQVSKSLDNNRGTRKLSDANYYTLDISPSKNELEHIDKLVILELAERGLHSKEASKSEDLYMYYEDQKEQLTNHYLKLYTQDVMKAYAQNFGAKVYVDIDNLPSRSEATKINTEVNKLVEEYIVANGLRNGIIKIDLPKFAGYPNASRIAVSVDNLKVRRDYYEFEYKGYKLFANKTIAELKNNKIEIDPKRLEHYLDKAIKIEAKRNEEINLKEKFKDIEVNTFKFKEKEITLYEFEYKADNLEPFKIKVNADKLNIEDDKVFISKGVLMDIVNAKIKEQIEEVVSPLREEYKENIWKEKGFNTEKRDLTDKDLMYYATVEKNRSYKRTNTLDLKIIDYNDALKKDIEQCLSDGKTKYAQQLSEQYKRDKHTNEVIFEGTKKGGNNRHIHVVMSRHDAYNKEPLYKVSLSPNTNHRSGDRIIHRGFNRSEFFQDVESTFDKKFDYNREWEQTYEFKNRTVKEKNIEGAYAKGYAKGKLKQEVYKHVGLQQVKEELSPKKHLNEINPIKKIQQEMRGVPIPTSLPKSKIDLVFKIIKAIINQTQQTIQY